MSRSSDTEEEKGGRGKHREMKLLRPNSHHSQQLQTQTITVALANNLRRCRVK